MIFNFTMTANSSWFKNDLSQYLQDVLTKNMIIKAQMKKELFTLTKTSFFFILVAFEFKNVVIDLKMSRK